MNQDFPNHQSLGMAYHGWVKQPFRVQGRPVALNKAEYKKFTQNVSYFMVQVNFWETIACWVLIKYKEDLQSPRGLLKYFSSFQWPMCEARFSSTTSTKWHPATDWMQEQWWEPSCASRQMSDVKETCTMGKPCVSASTFFGFRNSYFLLKWDLY